MIGVYKIENIVNNLVYIGQSIDIESRWKQHKNRPFDKNSKDYNIPLYKVIRKYGFDNFRFEVIEECLKEELNEKEQYWIDYYDSFFNGYNESVGGLIHCRYSNYSKEKIIGVINDLKYSTMKHGEIAEKWNISKEMVQGINTGRYWKHNTSYPLQSKTENKKIYKYICKYCNDTFITDDKDQIYCSHKCFSLSQRKTERPSKEKLLELIKTTSFLQIGKTYNVSDNTIRNWCKLYGLPYKKKDVKEIIN